MFASLSSCNYLRVLVDVASHFQAHNEDNRNNIAISPYGATSVLIALEEGVCGAAGREIFHTIRLPLDPSTMRVGLRDIHRHLKVKIEFFHEKKFSVYITL